MSRRRDAMIDAIIARNYHKDTERIARKVYTRIYSRKENLAIKCVRT